MNKKDKNIEEIKKIISNYNRNLTNEEWEKIIDLRCYNFFKPVIDETIEWSNEDFTVTLFYGYRCERRIMVNYKEYCDDRLIKSYMNLSSAIDEIYDNGRIDFYIYTDNLTMIDFLLNDFNFSDKITYRGFSKQPTIQEIKSFLQELKEELLPNYEKQELIEKISKMSLEDIKKIMK